MRTILVEDSQLAREGLLRMLTAFPFIDILGEAETLEQALALCDKEQPDLIFLDIHLPGGSGFDLLEALPYHPKVIFTTAYCDHAIKSFEYNTIDYLIKPIRKDRLKNAIEKLSRGSNGEPETEANVDPLEVDSRIFVKDDERCFLIEVESIDYIESCKNHVILYFEGEKAFVKKTLNHVESRLPRKLFFRANRQYIVNLKYIKNIRLTVSDAYEIVMNNDLTIEISRRNSVLLKDLLSL